MFMRRLNNRVVILVALSLALVGLKQIALAQSSDGIWTDFEKISKFPTASTYPCIVSDKSGVVHVLWSEDVGGQTSNPELNPDGSQKLNDRGDPYDLLDNLGNTLYYTRWDGKRWLPPIDVQNNPNGTLEFPRAAIDSKGVLHVVWIVSSAELVMVYYSHVPAYKADSAQEWSVPVVIAGPTHASYYPIDIAVDSRDGLHVLYSQVSGNPGAQVINSFDGGESWSNPTWLFVTQDLRGSGEGVSTVSLVSDGRDRLHATWTVFDSTGNGKFVYYSRSEDLGYTWSQPFEVARWQPGWYETDWGSLAIVNDEIHLTWKGGERAYLNERISEDGGKTWGESRRILSDLVGENGFASLVVDSSNRLHMLVIKRAVEQSIVHGIWYTTWDKDHWDDPVLLGTRNFSIYWNMNKLTEEEALQVMHGTFTADGLRYQMATVLNGNELFLVVVNEFGGDIWSSRAILPAPRIDPHPYPQLTATPTETPKPTTKGDTITPTPLPPNLQSGGQVDPSGQSTILLLGLVPAVLIIVAFVAYLRLFKRS
jgi:hypothetical protein